VGGETWSHAVIRRSAAVGDRAQGEEMTSGAPPEERVIYLKRFQGMEFDFQGKIVLTRYDHCEFVKCTLLIDLDTEQLAFTNCVFKDCNLDRLQQARAIYAKDNFFDRPLEKQRAEFDARLAQALAARKAKK
jgi:hypothetical protein